jgi:hypothetical protein
MRQHLENKYSEINLEIVIDAHIHDQAKISRDTFADRISNVKGIRTKEFPLGFYLDDISKLSRLEQLHQIVNTGKFKGQTFTDNKLFAIGVPQKLFLWFKNTTATTLHKQLLHWHAAYYAFNSFQEFADEEFDPLVLKEVKKILKQFYPENFKEKFYIDNIENSKKYKATKEYGLKYYYEKSEEYTGSLPPEFLKNPYRDPLSSIEDSDYDWGLLPNCKFSLLISYFNELDWIIIAERSKTKLIEFHKWSIDNKRMSIKEIDDIIQNADNDTLQRAESDSDMWQKWKYTFQNFEIRKEFTYSLVPKNNSHGGYVYLQQDETSATKIGWTKNEGFQRKAGNQTGNPTVLTEIGRFMASSTKTETVLHEMFRDKQTRRGGEWFWLTESDIENILNYEWRMKNNIF